MPSQIHPTAVVAPGAELGRDVEIGPHSVVGPEVVIGDRTRIGPQVVIDGRTTIGEDNQIVGLASLGGPPQDLSYKGEPTELPIGDRNTIREFVTVNRGTVKGGGIARIGSDCLLMACCHVAHDCDLADRIIMANNVLLAGHVKVEEQANISGGAAAHHFITIGAYSYIGGMTRIIQDAPPYMILEGHPSRVRGVNVIGLQRGGYPEHEIEGLRQAFRLIWRSGDPRRSTLDGLKSRGDVSPLIAHLVASLLNTEKGSKGRYRESLREQFQRAGVGRVLGERGAMSEGSPAATAPGSPGSADRRLRVAVVGAGHLGRFHARIYAANERCRLVAVVDPNAERARAVASECGCAALEDAAELPRELDAVSIAVPTALHARVAIPLLERGVRALVEKPLAASLEEADAILAAARRGQSRVAVGHVERFQPGLRKVREMRLAPRFIECHRLAPFSFRSLDVGVVHDLMIHDLDLVLDLVGSEVQSFDAAGGAILTEREDVASVRLVFENGARANVTASRASLSPMRRFRFFSREAYVSLDFVKNYGLVVRKGPEWEAGRKALKEMDPAALAQREDWLTSRVLQVEELDLGGEERPLQAELDSFLRSVQDDVDPEVTGDEGRRALALAERIAADIRAQRW